MSDFKQLNREEYDALSEKDKEIFQQSYLNHHLPMFEKYTEGTGLSAKMLLAQTAKESLYGVSGLSFSDFNYGGQKYFGDLNIKDAYSLYNTNEEFKSKEEADAYAKEQESKGFKTSYVKELKGEDGVYYQWRGQQPFKKFKTAEEGVRAQVEFFSKSPKLYKDIGKIEDPYKQMEAIKNAGYSTDSTGTYLTDIYNIYENINVTKPTVEQTIEGISSDEPTMEEQAAEIEKRTVSEQQIKGNNITTVKPSNNVKETEEQEINLFTPDPQPKYIDSPIGPDEIPVFNEKDFGNKMFYQLKSDERVIQNHYGLSQEITYKILKINQVFIEMKIVLIILITMKNTTQV